MEVTAVPDIDNERSSWKAIPKDIRQSVLRLLAVLATLALTAVLVEVVLGIAGSQHEDPWSLVGEDAGIIGVLAALLAAYVAALALREVEVRRPDPCVVPREEVVLNKDPAAATHGDVALKDLTLKLMITNEGQMVARDLLLRLAFKGFRGTPSGGAGWKGVATDPVLHCPTATWRANGGLVYKGFPEDIDLNFTAGTYRTTEAPQIDFEIVADESIRVKKGTLPFERDW